MGEVNSDTHGRDKLELEVVQELSPTPESGLYVAQEREEAVSAAVSVVVASARRGVVALCASVAHIIRKNIRLQQQILDLEDKLRSVEKSISPSEDCASSQCPSSHGFTIDSLPESPTAQRCGSAPPNFVASSLKVSRGEAQGAAALTTCQNQGGISSGKCSCDRCQLRQHKSHTTEAAETGLVFLRGQTRASTGNLNLGRGFHPTASSSFMRKKYSTISLRRIRRTTVAARQGRGTVSTCSQRSSDTNLEQQGFGNKASNKSCIVTVAEVYPAPPHPTTTTTTTESDAVKLLAQKLTSVLQESETQLQEDPEDLVCGPSEDLSGGSLFTVSGEALCSPYPLAGCECVVCIQLSSNPECPLYVLSTEEGSLLPKGSTVLVRGSRVGTVIYFGHSKQPAQDPNFPQHSLLVLPPASSIEATADEPPKDFTSPASGTSNASFASPLGVTIALWPPDQGEVFVPLNDVICQLDEEAGTCTREDRADLGLKSGNSGKCAGGNSPVAAQRDIQWLDQTCTPPKDDKGLRGRLLMHECLKKSNTDADSRTSLESMEKSFVSVANSQCSCKSCTEDAPASTVNRQMENVPLESHTGVTAVLPITAGKRDGTFTKPIITETQTSFYDVSESNYAHHERYSGSTDNEALPSTKRDREKLQLGDTWDSGCYMSLGQYSSECSEQQSDMESEYSSMGSPWACSLGEALDSVWKKHKHHENHDLFGGVSAIKFASDREIELSDYGKFRKKMRDDSSC